MKTMTCRDMGGPCDTKFTSETPEEMMKKGAEHLKMQTDKDHTKAAEEMEAMTEKETNEWNDTFMEKWNNTPNS